MPPLVSTEWLASELGKPDLLVFDATMYLPNEKRSGREEFVAAHIPGARFFDIDAIADDETDLPHMLPTPGRFSHLIGRLGVGNQSRVVFYDQKGLSSAARGLVDDGRLRPRPGFGARWRPAEMACRGPPARGGRAGAACAGPVPRRLARRPRPRDR